MSLKNTRQNAGLDAAENRNAGGRNILIAFGIRAVGFPFLAVIRGQETGTGSSFSAAGGIAIKIGDHSGQFVRSPQYPARVLLQNNADSLGCRIFHCVLNANGFDRCLTGPLAVLTAFEILFLFVIPVHGVLPFLEAFEFRFTKRLEQCGGTRRFADAGFRDKAKP